MECADVVIVNIVSGVVKLEMLVKSRSREVNIEEKRRRVAYFLQGLHVFAAGRRLKLKR